MNLAVLLVVPLLAASSNRPSKPSDRFALRCYANGGQTVWVAPSMSSLTLRTKGPANEADLTAVVEDASLRLVEKRGLHPAAAPRIQQAPALLARHDLFLVELAAPLDKELLVALAEELSTAPVVLQVYPTSTRGSGRAFADDHLILSAKPGRLEALLARLLPVLEGTLVRRSRLADVALVTVGAPFAFDAMEASRWLLRDKSDDLLTAEPDLYRELTLTSEPDDPLAAQQWFLYRSADDTVPGVGEIFADEAWDLTMGSSDVVIAVVDSGIDINHEDLYQNVLAGFDAVDGDEDPSPECSSSPDGRDVSSSCPEYAPYRDSHGTSTSGIVAARGNNGLGVTGVCPRCSILPVRFIGDSASSSLTTAETFDRAVADGAWVINNSWGMNHSRFFPLSSVESTALRNARLNGRGGKGTVIVFAAGNETSDVGAEGYSRSPHVITVAASTNLDDWAYYSNYGLEVDVCAPSVGGAVSEDSYGIVTTDVTGDDGYDAGDYAYDFGGTSASSPVVAGLAGLILSANPELTADQVRILLTSTADKIVADKVDWEELMGEDLQSLWAYDENGHSPGFGYGRINAHAAVAAAASPTLQGGLCSVAGCTHCDDRNRCQVECSSESLCPNGAICLDGLCEAPAPHATDIGEPCVPECDVCVSAFDNQFEPVDLCSAVCESNDDCPTGFDCRFTAAGGARICVVGIDGAGEPADFRKCFDMMVGAQVVVLGSDDQPYCSDICASDEPNACPYGFTCGNANCECTRTMGGDWCSQYTCSEVSSGFGDWPFPLCFPDPSFGVTCTSDIDCKLGDYCGPDGSCRIDDHEGCKACIACTSSDECGGRGQCMDMEDGNGSRCMIPCVEDGACPGNSVCRAVPYHHRTTFACVGANDGGGGEICDPSFTCAVGCRDDLPCADGLVCSAAGECVPPDPAPEPPKEGCACGGANLSPLAIAFILVILARRRRLVWGS